MSTADGKCDETDLLPRKMLCKWRVETDGACRLISRGGDDDDDIDDDGRSACSGAESATAMSKARHTTATQCSWRCMMYDVKR